MNYGKLIYLIADIGSKTSHFENLHNQWFSVIFGVDQERTLNIFIITVLPLIEYSCVMFDLIRLSFDFK